MVSKLKGKEWYQIVAPKFFGDFVIGETLSTVPEQIKGRVVETSLSDITGDVNKYYIKLYFKVTEVNGTKAITQFFGHDCTRDYIARIVQTRTTRIDTNDVVSLLDGNLRVKTIAISNRRVSNVLESKIRKLVSELVVSELKKLKTEQFVRDMVDGILQQKIRKSISKIYPLRFFEFRKTEVL